MEYGTVYGHGAYLGPDFTAECAAATRERFGAGQVRGGLQAHAVADPEEARQLASFFAWTAWTSAANRPGEAYSYTANWPPEPLAGNELTAHALVWSAVSIIALLGGMGIVLWFFGRFDWLGWTKEQPPLRFIPPDDVALAPAQRAIVWFLLVVSALFLLQTLLGGVIAHYRAES